MRGRLRWGLALLMGVGCASGAGSRLAQREAMLGTRGASARAAHEVCVDAGGAGLRFPGFVIGIEEADRKAIGLAPGRGLDDEPLIDAAAVARLRSAEGDPAWADYLTKRLDDGTRSFVSHIVRYEVEGGPLPAVRARFAYNAYASDAAVAGHDVGAGQAFERGALALQDLGPELAASLGSGEFTHVIVACMGWNVGQAAALERFNSLVLGLLDAPSEQAIRPLFLGLTWPSGWAGSKLAQAAGYANKAGDADEVGLLWAGLLLQRVLPEALEGLAKPPQVVAIGHSFGARVLFTAAASEALLAGSSGASGRGPDVLIGLQGAFSVERFFDDVGLEGAPYGGLAQAVRRTCLTWSRHDTATQWAQSILTIPHAGAPVGAKLAKEHGGPFRFLQVGDTGSIALPIEAGLFYLDASSIVRFRERGAAVGGAHSDVFHPDTSRMLSGLLGP